MLHVFGNGNRQYTFYNTMKKRLFILLLATICAGTAYSQGYTIRGSVGKTHLKRVFLQLYSAKDSVVKYQTRIEPDGTFVFKGSLPEPRLAEIRLASTSRGFFFYLENNPITLKVDPNDIDNTRINGSYSNSQYRYILEDCTLKQDSVNECLAEYIRQNPESIFGPHILATQPCFALLTPRELAGYVSKFTGAATRTYYYRYLQTKVRQLSRVSVGQKLPDFVLPDTSSKDMTCYENIGNNKYLVINIWSSKNLSENDKSTLRSVHHKYKNKGVGFFSVSFDVHRDTWIRTIEESHFSWKHASDLLGWESVIANTLCIPYIPCNIIIDSEGTIIARDVPNARLADELQNMFNKKKR